jgi:hypothetical protein
MPKQVDGQWISDDGRWRWDGHAWQPVQSASTPENSPAAPKPDLWLRPILCLVGVGIVIGGLAWIGWLIAVVGVLLVIVAGIHSGLRSWTGWKRVPGLSGSKSAGAFALVLALYAVLAPAAVWGIARTAGSSSGPPAGGTVSSTSTSNPAALGAPAATPTVSATPAPTPTPTTSPTPTATPASALPTSAPATPPPPPPTAAPAPAPAVPAGCYPLSNSGTCYRPGEFCRNSDHGATGRAADGEAIVCRYNNGWRWEPA